MDERPEPPRPRAPGSQWREVKNLEDLRVLAENWFSNPTDLDWNEIRFVMDGIRRVTIELEALRSERDALLLRRDELLSLVAKISQITPFPDEIRNWESQRRALIAEVGTLRSRIQELEHEHQK